MCPVSLADLNRTVTDDRPCAKCGYNLRGLPIAGRCPECGAPVYTPVDAGVDDPLSVMPMNVIKTFRLGGWLCVLCVVLLVAVSAGVFFARWSPAFSFAMLGGVALVWICGVILITPALNIRQGVDRGFARGSPLRIAACTLQIGWVASAIFAMIAATPTALPAAPAGLLRSLIFLSSALGIAGLATLTILLMRLAEWARDDVAHRSLNWAIWILPLTSALLWIGPIPLLFANVILGLLWFSAVIAFLYGLYSLSQSLTFSVIHAQEYHDRMIRRLERSRRYDEHVAATVAESDRARERSGHD